MRVVAAFRSYLWNPPKNLLENHPAKANMTILHFMHLNTDVLLVVSE